MIDPDSEQLKRPRDRRDCVQTVINYGMVLRHMVESKNFQAGIELQLSPGGGHCSKEPLKNLKSITLKDMQVPNIHVGRYLVCQTLVDVPIIGGRTVIDFPIEDLESEVELISLNNCLDAPRWLSLGTIILIKEPYLAPKAVTESVTIKVVSPTDVIIIQESDKTLLQSVGALSWYVAERLSIDELRLKAKELFEQNKYEEALKYYNRALLLEPDSAVMHLNRAAVLIKMEYFNEAYEAAQKALENGADKKKSLFRLGVASYGMREWEASMQHFKALKEQFPDNNEVKIELPKCERRLREARTGKYNFGELFHLANIPNERFLDVADYTGPIKIVDIPGKGRGVIATRNIEKGTLLMVSKAFSMATYEGQDVDDEDFDEHDYVHQLNFIKTTDKLLRNPQRADEVYGLHAVNKFSDNNSIPKGVIDVGRIVDICNTNGFGCESVIDDIPCLVQQKKRNYNNSGLWIMPSYINHSCIANSLSNYYGDILVYHAICDLKKGEEITSSYVDEIIPYKKRVDILQAKYDFLCDCQLCENQKNDVFYDERQKLAEQITSDDMYKMIDDKPRKYLNLALPIIKKIRTMYKSDNKFRHDLSMALTFASHAYIATRDHESAAKLLEEGYECLNESVKYLLGVKILLQLAECYSAMGSPYLDVAKERVANAMKLLKIGMGVSREVFMQVHPQVRYIME